jgi:hypothetical protein
MRSVETRSVLLDPVVLVALLGWLAAGSLFLWFPSILEGVNTGANRWPLWLVEALLWLQLLLLVSCCIGTLGKSAANLVYGKRLLPNILAIALSLPILIVAAFFWHTYWFGSEPALQPGSLLIPQ